MKNRILIIIGTVFALTLFSSLMIPTFAVHTGEGNHPTPQPPPHSLCKSGPMPDGEGWVFIDCEWEQYTDPIIAQGCVLTHTWNPELQRCEIWWNSAYITLPLLILIISASIIMPIVIWRKRK